jgi:hypothetical protein
MAENRKFDGIVGTGKGGGKVNPKAGMNRQRSTSMGNKSTLQRNYTNVDTKFGGSFDGKGRAYPGK